MEEVTAGDPCGGLKWLRRNSLRGLKAKLAALGMLLSHVNPTNSQRSELFPQSESKISLTGAAPPTESAILLHSPRQKTIYSSRTSGHQRRYEKERADWQRQK